MSIPFYHAPNLASDPELHVIDQNTKELVPGAKVLEAFFEIKGIKEGDMFQIDRHMENAMRRTKRETKVGDVYYLVPIRNPQTVTLASAAMPSIVVDGTALEINTVPFLCRNYIIQCVAAAINTIQGILDVVNEATNTNLGITVNPTVVLSEETLAGLPSQAAIFGCDADMDIYGRTSRENNIDAKTHRLRYTGGHIHNSFGPVGNWYTGAWTSEEVDTLEHRQKFFADNMYRLATLYDRLIGIATTAINTSPYESMRREVYGQAGRIRLQPYGGIEYRTPSSAWLLDSSLTSYVFYWAQVANNVIFQPKLEERINSLSSIEDVITTINTGDSVKAMELIAKTCDALLGESGITLSRHQESNILKYTKYVHENGGADTVFDPLQVSQRWGAKGFMPLHGVLPTVDSFVKINQL